MDSELRALAQAYFDAAYDMDAERFAALFHPNSSVSSLARVGNETRVGVTPIATWLDMVRNARAPRVLGLARRDELLSIDVAGPIALVKLKLQIPPRYFTDMLSCVLVDGTWRIIQKVTTVETRDE